jgi:DNA (cytosine-5)-methyltransferase 1
MLKIGTDFSGIGSPEQALIKLGIKHKSMFACDVDKYAKKSYLANYKTENFYDDITTRNHNEAPYVDLYVAGFPCQAFSMAGKRLGFEDTRGTLFYDLLKYLKAKKPKYFILENVKGLLSNNNGKTFLTILDCLAKTVNGQYSFTNYEDGLNYYVYYKVLNTKDYGIPQNRERVFIVGFRDEKHSFKFPKKIPLELKLKDLLQDNVNNKYYLSDDYVKKLEEYNERNKKKGNGFRAKFHNPENDIMSTLKISGDSKDDLIKLTRLEDLQLKVKKRINETPKEINEFLKKHKKNSIKEIAEKLQIPKTQLEHYFRTDKYRAIPCPKIWKKLKELLKFDDTYDDAVIEYEEKLSTFETAQRLYDANGISATLQTNEGNYYKTYKRIRRLTPLECFRLQGFPDSFHKKCVDSGLSDTQLYKQAGNSITVDVMSYLIKEILINES